MAQEWLREWLRDEDFYRDIATRALAIAVVATIALVYSVLTGWVKNPVTVVLVRAMLMGVIAAVSVVAVKELFGRRRHPLRILAVVVATLTALVGWFWWASGVSAREFADVFLHPWRDPSTFVAVVTGAVLLFLFLIGRELWLRWRQEGSASVASKRDG